MAKRHLVNYAAYISIMSMFQNFQKMLPYIQVKEIFYNRFQTFDILKGLELKTL